MTGVYIAKIANGITKIVNLRNVASASLYKTTISVEYNFAEIIGERYSEGQIASKPMKETFVWNTEEKAQNEFSKLQKNMEELK
jgi:hypothetical protein